MPYQVAQVNYDIQTPETIKDVFYSLKVLSSNVDEILQRIESRIEKEKSRLSQVAERSSRCQAKIKRIEGSTKATTVFSTAKFPGSKVLPQAESIFSNSQNLIDTLPPVDDSVQYIPADAKRSPINNAKLSQDLDIILTRLHASPHLSEKSSAIYENGVKGGVGMFPSADIKTTASLLVFNSTINPYKEYQALDNLASAGRFGSTVSSMSYLILLF